MKAAYSKILELREEHKAKYAAWKQVEDAWYGQRREDHLKRCVPASRVSPAVCTCLCERACMCLRVCAER